MFSNIEVVKQKFAKLEKEYNDEGQSEEEIAKVSVTEPESNDNLAKLSYPSNVDNMKDYLFLNICHFGRCEVELFPGSYVYMSPGILNMTSSSHRPKWQMFRNR